MWTNFLLHNWKHLSCPPVLAALRTTSSAVGVVLQSHGTSRLLSHRFIHLRFISSTVVEEVTNKLISSRSPKGFSILKSDGFKKKALGLEKVKVISNQVSRSNSSSSIRQLRVPQKFWTLEMVSRSSSSRCCAAVM